MPSGHGQSGHRQSGHSEEGHREDDVLRLPLVGEIAAGGPLLAEENIEEHLAVPETMKGDFLLRVKGESMIQAGILDGDIVVVERTDDARNGEIVVALAGDDESADEATVKTFYREEARIRLQPENDSMEPIYTPYVKILGRVRGVFRTL
jgi:repressor LexA